MRSNKDLEEARVLPCKVLVCLRLIPERNLTVVGQKVGDKPQPLALIFTHVREGADTYFGLLESDMRIHAAPLDLARNLVHFETSLLLPPERFVRDTAWVTSEEGSSMWQYLYFADIVEVERNTLLLDLPKRKTFVQVNLEEARSFVYSVQRGHFQRLKDSRWFSAQKIQKAA